MNKPLPTVIIYNPNSTGNSEANAKQLARELRAAGVSVSTKQTTHAGHGEEIAASYAKKNKALLLISSSGDGGYHELVNGALQEPGSSKLVLGLLPSGNANDHFSSLGSDSTVDAILRQNIRRIDTIRVTATIKGQTWVRYAHSYVGIGVTAVAAKKLTEERPNVFTEKWIVARALFSFNYVKLTEANKIRRYSSLVFSNIDRMSKVIKLSDEASVTDGKFEVNSIHFHSKLRLIAYLLSAAMIGLKGVQSLSRYEAVASSSLPIQLDGETYSIDAGSRILIESVQQNMRCIL